MPGPGRARATASSLGSLLLILCAAAGTGSATESHSFAESTNGFGLDLYKRLKEGPGNLVFSPASVATALTMATGGAKGVTGEEMRNVLRLGSAPGGAMEDSGRLLKDLQASPRGVTFRVANRLFGERGYRFEPSYLDATKEAYGASLEAMDFRGAAEPARVAINQWVEAQTEKRILNLVPSGGVTKDTRLVLVNAIYFLGDWASPFTKEATGPAAFHLSPSSSKDVPTMHQTGSFLWMQGDGFQALEMPYRENAFSILVLLPQAVDGLPALEDQLTAGELARVVDGLVRKQVAIALPRFEVNPPESIPLSVILKGLGMKAAFDRRRADFTGIANPPDPADRLYISEVFHKAFVKTDEKGTEAAAATAVLMPRAASALVPEAPIPFNADRPFLFMVRDRKSGIVLFMGRVVDPSLK